MPADAIAVQGLTAQFLADKPLFAAVADKFLAFVGDAPLVAHNAGFDIAFLNAELKRIAKSVIATERVRWVISAGVYRALDKRDSARGTTPNRRIRDYSLPAPSDSAT
jgi:DNA polymerase III epsilon subunit-like protein